MRYAVYGSGGVGGYMAAALALAGADCTVVTTPRHASAIGRDGLRVARDNDELTVALPAVSDPRELGPVDVVLVALKLYQLADALDDLGALIGPDTLVVPLQNGVAAPSMIESAHPGAHVAAGLTTIIAYLTGPGQIRVKGSLPRVTLAAHTRAGLPHPGLEALVGDLGGDYVDVRTADDIDRALWWKYALILTFGGVCTLANATIGEVRELPDTRALITRSLEEVYAVARAEGVALTRGDLSQIEDSLEAAPADSTTSMQRDLREGKPSELDYLNGYFVRLARTHDIDVPLQEAIAAVATLHARRGHV